MSRLFPVNAGRNPIRPCRAADINGFVPERAADILGLSAPLSGFCVATCFVPSSIIQLCLFCHRYISVRNTAPRVSCCFSKIINNSEV